MRKYIFILMLVSSGLFSQTIVHDKKDARLIAYQDSTTMYLYGQYQIKLANCISNKSNTKIGVVAMGAIYKYAEKYKIDDNYKGICVLRGKSYEHYSQINNLTFSYLQSDNNLMSWTPDVYKKPVNIVTYKPKPVKKKVLIAVMDSVAKPKQKPVYKIPEKKLNDTILMPSGERITRAEFENRYGKETYNFKVDDRHN